MGGCVCVWGDGDGGAVGGCQGVSGAGEIAISFLPIFSSSLFRPLPYHG